MQRFDCLTSVVANPTRNGNEFTDSDFLVWLHESFAMASENNIKITFRDCIVLLGAKGI